MSALIQAQGLTKSYGSLKAVNDVSFTVEPGRIIGLIGPNGAGKTTLLNALLGLTAFEGQLTVMGLDPFKQRKALMQKIAFVSDVAVLPKWIVVDNLLEFVETMHPNFSINEAREFLSQTKIKRDSKVGALSKGMTVQLHLAIIMAIDADLLILDEPTLGLDILYRKDFYSRLLGDYYDDSRTILVTTHQVEEIEHILTDVMFIEEGRLVLNDSVENLADRYIEVMASSAHYDALELMKPLSSTETFGKRVYLFDGVERQKLAEFGETRTPSIADLFVGVLRGIRQ